MSGYADDISINLEDRGKLWQNDWFPDKGALIEVAVVVQNGNGSTEEEKPLGLFEIDNITSSEPPSEVSIKAVSIPEKTELRGIMRSRSWEKTRFSMIANDVATGTGMDLFYDTEDIDIERVEQTEQSDLSFLMGLCKNYGLALKITDNQIIIFDEEKYEQAEPIAEITRGETPVKSYKFETTIREVYAACRVVYQFPKTKEKLEYIFRIPNKNGNTLQVNAQVNSIAEAEKLAKKELRNRNKEETKGNFSIPGNIKYFAGATLMFNGYGWFDGKYIIEKISSSENNGYNMTLDVRRCLDGY
ncbi:hypothetical protein LJC10_00490 [Selenomonadales bacterium OttesenSCG-928-I06]|nr:hypothetical protein [Selenomonadales bacterium OttesenSCG-928-I06]